MQIKNTKTGTIYPSMKSAVDSFKCPGPCSPDCFLFELHKSAIEPDKHVHMCDPGYYCEKENRERLMKLLDLEIVSGTEDWPDYEPDKPYIALIRDGAVRDAQVYTKPCFAEDYDALGVDSWYDYDDAEVYLGIFMGPDALQKAAEYACTVPENIRLIDIEAELKKEKEN